MLSATKLGFMFQNGDLEWRRRQIGQYFVVKTVKNDPVRATGVYRHLRRHAGGDHAAEAFYTLLQENDIRLWYHLVAQTRPAPVPLPG